MSILEITNKISQLKEEQAKAQKVLNDINLKLKVQYSKIAIEKSIRALSLIKIAYVEPQTHGFYAIVGKADADEYEGLRKGTCKRFKKLFSKSDKVETKVVDVTDPSIMKSYVPTGNESYPNAIKVEEDEEIFYDILGEQQAVRLDINDSETGFVTYESPPGVRTIEKNIELLKSYNIPISKKLIEFIMKDLQNELKSINDLNSHYASVCDII